MSNLDERRAQLRRLAFERRADHEPKYGCQSLKADFAPLVAEGEAELIDFYNYCQFAVEKCEVLLAAGGAMIAPHGEDLRSRRDNWEQLRERLFQLWCDLLDFELTEDA